MIRATTESSAAWLGKVPAEWRVVPAAALFSDRKTKSLSSDVHLTPSQKYGVLPQTEYMSRTGNKVVLNLTGADNMRHVEPGDFVSHLRSFQGGLEYSTVPGKVSAAYTVLKPVTRNPAHGPYFRYLFKSTQYVQALQTTTDQLRDGQSIRYAQFKLIPLPLPPFDEQRAIADYLDRETAQIDAFIAKNEELIIFLSDRELAATTAAVTGQTFPETCTIRTGHEWVGPFRSTWDFVPIKSKFSVVTGKMLNASNTEGVGHDYIRAGNIQTYGLDLGVVTRMLATRMEARRLDIRRGDVLFVEGGGGYGRSILIEHDMPGWIFQNHVIRLRPIQTTDDIDSSRFVHLWLKYLRSIGHFEALSAFATIPNVSGDKLGRIPFPLASSNEYSTAVRDGERALETIAQAKSVANEAIRLAKERRAALISAAVTGKIDVRSKS